MKLSELTVAGGAPLWRLFYHPTTEFPLSAPDTARSGRRQLRRDSTQGIFLLEDAMSKEVPVSPRLENELAVLDSLQLIKAVGDSLVCIVTADKDVIPLPGTLRALGGLLIEKADFTAEALGIVLEAEA